MKCTSSWMVACGFRLLAYQQVIPIERSAKVINTLPCTTPRPRALSAHKPQSVRGAPGAPRPSDHECPQASGYGICLDDALDGGSAVCRDLRSRRCKFASAPSASSAPLLLILGPQQDQLGRNENHYCGQHRQC